MHNIMVYCVYDKYGLNSMASFV